MVTVREDDNLHPYCLETKDNYILIRYMHGNAARMVLQQITNNTRFLIPSWVQVPHLASHVLGQLARRVAADWQHQWGFAPLLMETFVDPGRFAGTCYRAAGWMMLGETSGRGLARPGKHYQSSPRLVLVKPLHEDCRRLLCTEPLPGGAVQ